MCDSARMDPIASLVRSIHLLGAAAWFGGAFAMNVVVLPVVLGTGFAARRAVAARVFFGFERIAIPAALATVASGLVLAIAYGRITDVGALATPYGAVWLLAVVVVAGVLGIGSRVSSPAARRLFADDGLWAPDGSSGPALDAAIAGLRGSLRLELVGLGTAFVLMELLATRL